MLYPFSGDDSVPRAQKLAADATRYGLPFLGEPIPGGFSRTDMRSPEVIAAGARIAAESGADFVKTFYTGDAASMRLVVEYASVPVVILGGGKKDTLRELYQEVYDAVMVAGCAGVAIGNNIWRADDPAAVTRGLAAIVHGGVDVDEALDLAGALVPA
jgi:DhnA family fructose-bisphosphate aldolase class Ia